MIQLIQLIFWSLLFVVCTCIIISTLHYLWRQRRYLNAMKAFHRQCRLYQLYRFVVFGDDTTILTMLWNDVDTVGMAEIGFNPFTVSPDFREFVSNKQFYDEVMSISRTEMLNQMNTTNPEMLTKLKPYIGEI